MTNRAVYTDINTHEMSAYKEQITNLCIQTYFNLYGVMPGAQELAEMLGCDDDEKKAA